MKKKIAIIIATLLMALPFALNTNSAFAESITVGDDSFEYETEYDPNTQTDPGAAEGEIEKRIVTVVNVLATLVGVIAVIMIIWGGFTYSISMGDPSKAQRAKMIITAAIIGLVLCILSAAIANAVVTLSQGGTL